jgi:hypothetical protein
MRCLRLVPVLAALFLSLASSSSLRGPAYATLDPAQARTLEVSLVGGGATLCPGAMNQLHVVVTDAAQKRLSTWSALDAKRDGHLSFAVFEWSPDVGSIDPDGFYQPPVDPMPLLDAPLTVTVRLVGNPKVSAQLVLPTSYGCGAHVDVAGAAGADGDHGMNGSGGVGGGAVASEGTAPSGTSGNSGLNGYNGQNGGHAAQVEVALAYVQSRTHGQLVLARVTRLDLPSAIRYVVFDPHGAPLDVDARGGHGGAGGDGGSGGAGGDGGDNQGVGDGGNGASAGDGGSGANGGDGGDGAQVTLRFDAAHPELASLVRVDRGGGAGGAAGRAGEGGSGGAPGRSRVGSWGKGGDSGTDGSPGSHAGRPGRPGPEPAFRGEPVEGLFGAEKGRGWPILAGATSAAVDTYPGSR